MRLRLSRLSWTLPSFAAANGTEMVELPVNAEDGVGFNFAYPIGVDPVRWMSSRTLSCALDFLIVAPVRLRFDVRCTADSLMPIIDVGYV